jgi:hypothetical protein
MMRFILQRCPACLSERTIDKLDNPDLPKAVALVEERCADCEPDGYEEWFDAEGGSIPTPLSLLSTSGALNMEH